MHLLGACAAAVLAAAAFACSAVLQQRDARQVPADKTLSLRLFGALLRRRTWLVGVGAMVVAYGLQALALGLGPVAVVEPIITAELIFAVPVAVRLHGRRPGRREWAGMLAVAAGVSAFLVGARPAGGTSEPSTLHWLVGAAPAAVVVAALVVLARGPESPRRAGLLAGAAGLTFGLLAVVTKSAVGLLTHVGFVALVTSWRPEALLLLGAGGFLVGQSSYQAAPLASSLPIMDAAEPISAVMLSAWVLGERLRPAPLPLSFEVAGAAAAVLGIFLLGRSPLVQAIYASTERQKRRQRQEAQPESEAMRGQSAISSVNSSAGIGRASR